MTESLCRRERRRSADPQNMPRPCETDLVVVDTTWGTVQPIQLASGVRTVGELEVVDLVADGALLVDTRVADSRSGVGIPGAVHLPHDQVAQQLAELDRSRVSILFCNGPQCTQTPDAITALLDAGYPAEAIAYYRGGLHDWVTLGFPTDEV
jgi:rhodanese-related sulfurtransferase